MSNIDLEEELEKELLNNLIKATQKKLQEKRSLEDSQANTKRIALLQEQIQNYKTQLDLLQKSYKLFYTLGNLK